MKQWFPFTDYDFYAYLTTGVILITAVDYAFFGGVLIAKKEWPVVHVVFWIATAYVVGQITANPSALILEQWLARRFLNSPVSVLLGLKPQRFRERLVRNILVGRVYDPLPEPIRHQLLAYSTRQLKLKSHAPIAPESVFNIASDRAHRFRFCRANGSISQLVWLLQEYVICCRYRLRIRFDARVQVVVA